MGFFFHFTWFSHSLVSPPFAACFFVSRRSNVAFLERKDRELSFVGKCRSWTLFPAPSVISLTVRHGLVMKLCLTLFKELRIAFSGLARLPVVLSCGCSVCASCSVIKYNSFLVKQLLQMLWSLWSRGQTTLQHQQRGTSGFVAFYHKRRIASDII